MPKLRCVWPGTRVVDPTLAHCGFFTEKEAYAEL